MRQSKSHPGARIIRFQSVCDRYAANEFNLPEAAAPLGINERTFRRCCPRFEDRGTLVNGSPSTILERAIHPWVPCGVFRSTSSRSITRPRGRWPASGTASDRPFHDGTGLPFWELCDGRGSWSAGTAPRVSFDWLRGVPSL